MCSTANKIPAEAHSRTLVRHTKWVQKSNYRSLPYECVWRREGMAWHPAMITQVSLHKCCQRVIIHITSYHGGLLIVCCWGFQRESSAHGIGGGGYRALVSKDNNTSLSLAETTAQTLHYVTLRKQSSSCLSLPGILMSAFLHSEEQTYWKGGMTKP